MDNLSLNHYENDNACMEERLNSPDWQNVKTINREPLHNMQNECLVRFVGMIQDILNPEYFFPSYNVKDNTNGSVSARTGLYRDILLCSDNEELILDNHKQAVRHPIFCIPIPGVNAWAVETSSVANLQNGGPTSGAKRSHEESSDTELGDVSNRIVRRTQETQSNSEENSSRIDNFEKYFPCPEAGGLACIVKHYGEREDWLVNTRVEVLGFLSVSSALEANWQDSDAEDRAMHPPPSLVPRIHALKIRKLQHCNPLLYSPSNNLGLQLNKVRDDLMTTLTQLLFGDTIAAEFLICNLLSSVYARTDGLTLGSLSLNLYNLVDSPEYPSLFYRFLQLLLPSTIYLPLSIDTLNTATFIPRKDYETNKLWSGRLQLPDDTTMVVDETALTPGQLGERGLRNMAALQSLAQCQKISYDFSYFQLDFHTNVPLIILSEGKSMIPVNVSVKLMPEAGTVASIAETFEAAHFFLSGKRLEVVRKFITLVRLRDCDMSTTDFVGPAWADLRQENPKLTQGDLHRLLVLARLLALSYGHESLTRLVWDKAVGMEKVRLARQPPTP